MTIFSIAFGFLILLGLYGILIFNNLVRLKNMAREGWSGIDVQLKRRANLIPNLVEAVRGYMTHEKELLSRVTELRSRSMKTDNPTEKGRLEGDLSRALANIMAVAENYPDLKANENFLDLQNQLSQIEGEIQMARRYYNGTVRDLNIKIESFPSNFVAGMFKFSPMNYFEIEDPADRAVPQVDL
jgi:LemA protein